MTQETIETDEHYESADLGLCAALVCLGHRLIQLDKSNPRKAYFVFNREASMDQIVSDYFDDRLQIKARKYFDTIKSLKSRIYSH